MPTDPQRIDDLSQTDLVRFILDVIHRSSLHYGFWFSEIRHQMGTARALEALRGAYERSLTIHGRPCEADPGTDWIDHQ